MKSKDDADTLRNAVHMALHEQFREKGQKFTSLSIVEYLTAAGYFNSDDACPLSAGIEGLIEQMISAEILQAANSQGSPVRIEVEPMSGRRQWQVSGGYTVGNG